MGYSFCAGKIVDDYLYFSDDMLNALCCVDLCNKKAFFLGQFPEEDSLIQNQHIKCLERHGKLYFIPNCGSHIHIFDLDSKEIKSVCYPKCLEARFVVSGACFVEDILWIFPASIKQPVITLDTVNQIVEQRYLFVDEIQKYKNDGGQDVWKICLIGNDVFFAVLGTSQIVKCSLGDCSINIKDIGIGKLEAIYSFGDKAIICTSDSKMFQWDIENDMIKEIVVNNSTNNKGAYLVFNNTAGDLYFIPNTGRTFFKYDTESYILTKLNLFSITGETLDGIINYAEFDIWNNKIVLFPRIGNSILLIQENDDVDFISGEITETAYKEQYYQALRLVAESGIIKESIKYSFNDYIHMMTNL